MLSSDQKYAYRIVKGTRIEHGNILRTPGSTLEECMSECDSEASCKNFNFIGVDSYCVTKKYSFSEVETSFTDP